MKIAFTIIAAATVLAAAPALAQEAEPFTGPHVGLEAGWGRVGGSRIGGDGFIYGATAGYDVAVGKARIGAEAEVVDSTQKSCVQFPVGAGHQEDCQRSDRDLYIGGRLGYVVDPRVLIYAKAGYTNARFSDRLSAVGGGELAGRAQDLSGFRVGGGVEYALTPRFYLTGEYRYSHYQHEVHQNQLLGGVGFRF